MTADLAAVAKSLVAPGKGILAADESSPTIVKRFDSIKLESTETSRRDYREMLFTTPGIGQHISGAILYDETLRQSSSSGKPLREVLKAAGVQPGIKVDTGAKAYPLHPGEKITEGLDGLAERIAEYQGLGATFAKWRAVITIGDGIPTRACIHANAHALARYAALCQEGGLVPIVEPEVLMDGTHTIERSYEVTAETLRETFAELALAGVDLAGMLLKPNMVLSGYSCPVKAPIEAVAKATLRCFRQTVPAAVPGIVFLSGGQSDEDATAHLSAMNALGNLPWQLSFSYGRALQAPALKAWGGKKSQMAAGQAAFAHRAKCNGEARYGRYTAAMERSAPASSVKLVSQD